MNSNGMNKRAASNSIEDLLRLKRLERPSAEFWTRFESDLRAKQLAAIVAKRPWWHGFSRGLMVVSRQRVPLGALAALVVTCVGVQHFGSAASHATASPFRSGITAAPVRPVHMVAVVASRSAPVAEEAEDESTDAVAADASAPASAALTPQSSHLTQAPEAAASSERSRASFAIASVSAIPTDGSLNPAGELIDANLTTAEAPSPQMARGFLASMPVFGSTLGSSRSPTTDPLAGMNPSSEERRFRLLAPALPATADLSTVASASSARVASQLSDDRLYESIHRYGVGGDRLSIKFKF